MPAFWMLFHTFFSENAVKAKFTFHLCCFWTWNFWGGKQRQNLTYSWNISVHWVWQTSTRQIMLNVTPTGFSRNGQKTSPHGEENWLVEVTAASDATLGLNGFVSWDFFRWSTPQVRTSPELILNFRWGKGGVGLSPHKVVDTIDWGKCWISHEQYNLFCTLEQMFNKSRRKVLWSIQRKRRLPARAGLALKDAFLHKLNGPNFQQSRKQRIANCEQQVQIVLELLSFSFANSYHCNVEMLASGNFPLILFYKRETNGQKMSFSQRWPLRDTAAIIVNWWKW